MSSIGFLRRKDYKLCHLLNDDTCSTKTIYERVDHVQIPDEKIMNKCICYFPQATKLTLEDGCAITTCESITTSLIRIIPLKQLKTLIIKSGYISFMIMIKLLSFAPNIQTFAFETMSISLIDKKDIEQNHIVQSVANTNIITNVTFNEKCTLEKVELLVMLFPRMEHLRIHILLYDTTSIFRLLLDTNTKNTSHLVSLCFQSDVIPSFEHWNQRINSESIHCRWKTIYTNNNLYLWR
ncbi:hypothetical protein I4U23_031433 [Adineta vaga]|nr:hypothetical protein I4U23_031433 [Adineta vaga]